MCCGNGRNIYVVIYKENDVFCGIMKVFCKCLNVVSGYGLYVYIVYVGGIYCIGVGGLYLYLFVIFYFCLCINKLIVV